MPNILYEPVEKYLNVLVPRRDAVIAEMDRFAKRNHVPIVSPAVARLLALVTEMTGAPV